MPAIRNSHDKIGSARTQYRKLNQIVTRQYLETEKRLHNEKTQTTKHLQTIFLKIHKQRNESHVS